MSRLFFNTNVLVSALTNRSIKARKAFFDENSEKYTCEYVLKEFRRVLRKAYSFSDDKIEEYNLLIKLKCIIVKDPHVNQVEKISLRDNSDKIIVAAAKELDCILITEDTKLLEDAKAYIEVCRPEDLKK